MRNISSEGIILKRINYGEADRIVTLITRNFGKVTLISKGVRKIKSRKRGHLEIFTKVKFSASYGNSQTGILTEAETLDSFELIRNNLKKISLAYYFCEIILKITENDHKQDSLYYLLDSYLSKIERSINLKELRTRFVNELLVDLGYWDNKEKLEFPDEFLSQVLEKNINSVRVGKKVLAS